MAMFGFVTFDTHEWPVAPTDDEQGVGAFGFYPSNRPYGTSVHRTVVENWNLAFNSCDI